MESEEQRDRLLHASGAYTSGRATGGDVVAWIQPTAGKTCPPSPDRAAAIEFLGHGYLVPAAWLSYRLGSEEALAYEPAPNMRRIEPVTAMLTLERALVEFLRSPSAAPNPQHWLRDICPWCFVPEWRLRVTDAGLADALDARWKTISSHMAHLSWAECSQPRQFSDWKIDNVIAAFRIFDDALRPTSTTLSDQLRSHLAVAEAARNGTAPPGLSTQVNDR